MSFRPPGLTAGPLHPPGPPPSRPTAAPSHLPPPAPGTHAYVQQFPHTLTLSSDAPSDDDLIIVGPPTRPAAAAHPSNSAGAAGTPVEPSRDAAKNSDDSTVDDTLAGPAPSVKQDEAKSSNSDSNGKLSIRQRKTMRKNRKLLVASSASEPEMDPARVPKVKKRSLADKSDSDTSQPALSNKRIKQLARKALVAKRKREQSSGSQTSSSDEAGSDKGVPLSRKQRRKQRHLASSSDDEPLVAPSRKKARKTALSATETGAESSNFVAPPPVAASGASTSSAAVATADASPVPPPSLTKPKVAIRPLAQAIAATKQARAVRFKNKFNQPPSPAAPASSFAPQPSTSKPVKNSAGTSKASLKKGKKGTDTSFASRKAGPSVFSIFSDNDLDAFVPTVKPGRSGGPGKSTGAQDDYDADATPLRPSTSSMKDKGKGKALVDEPSGSTTATAKPAPLRQAKLSFGFNTAEATASFTFTSLPSREISRGPRADGSEDEAVESEDEGGLPPLQGTFGWENEPSVRRLVEGAKTSEEMEAACEAILRAIPNLRKPNPPASTERYVTAWSELETVGEWMQRTGRTPAVWSFLPDADSSADIEDADVEARYRQMIADAGDDLYKWVDQPTQHPTLNILLQPTFREHAIDVYLDSLPPGSQGLARRRADICLARGRLPSKGTFAQLPLLDWEASDKTLYGTYEHYGLRLSAEEEKLSRELAKRPLKIRRERVTKLRRQPTAPVSASASSSSSTLELSPRLPDAKSTPSPATVSSSSAAATFSTPSFVLNPGAISNPSPLPYSSSHLMFSPFSRSTPAPHASTSRALDDADIDEADVGSEEEADSAAYGGEDQEDDGRWSESQTDAAATTDEDGVDQDRPPSSEGRPAVVAYTGKSTGNKFGVKGGVFKRVAQEMLQDGLLRSEGCQLFQTVANPPRQLPNGRSHLATVTTAVLANSKMSPARLDCHALMCELIRIQVFSGMDEPGRDVVALGAARLSQLKRNIDFFAANRSGGGERTFPNSSTTKKSGAKAGSIAAKQVVKTRMANQAARGETPTLLQPALIAYKENETKEQKEAKEAKRQQSRAAKGAVWDMTNAQLYEIHTGHRVVAIHSTGALRCGQFGLPGEKKMNHGVSVGAAVLSKYKLEKSKDFLFVEADIEDRTAPLEHPWSLKLYLAHPLPSPSSSAAGSSSAAAGSSSSSSSSTSPSVLASSPSAFSSTSARRSKAEPQWCDDARGRPVIGRPNVDRNSNGASQIQYRRGKLITTITNPTAGNKHLIEGVASFSLWYEANPDIVAQNQRTNEALDRGGARADYNEKKKIRREEATLKAKRGGGGDDADDEGGDEPEE